MWNSLSQIGNKETMRNTFKLKWKMIWFACSYQRRWLCHGHVAA